MTYASTIRISFLPVTNVLRATDSRCPLRPQCRFCSLSIHCQNWIQVDMKLLGITLNVPLNVDEYVQEWRKILHALKRILDLTVLLQNQIIKHFVEMLSYLLFTRCVLSKVTRRHVNANQIHFLLSVTKCPTLDLKSRLAEQRRTCFFENRPEVQTLSKWQLLTLLFFYFGDAF